MKDVIYNFIQQHMMIHIVYGAQNETYIED
jgi:hypothetical protein